MSDARELTICTVAFDSRTWLDLHHELAERLNPGVPLHWIVAENTGPEEGERIPDDGRFVLVEGERPEPRVYATASYHHAAGLGKALAGVRTRFLLVLDPDFFVVRKDWIAAVLSHMERHEIAIFGAPWHPSRLSKYRYFPCAHCTFFDLERVPLHTLDFAPDYESDRAYLEQKDGESWEPLRRLTDPLNLRKRRFVGTSRDTGWWIRERYGDDPDVRVECLKPVFRPSGSSRWLERLFPDHLSLVPQGELYYDERGFKERGLPDVRGFGWEEFVWSEAPFGFHVRCHPIRLKRPQTMEFHYACARRVLAAL